MNAEFFEAIADLEREKGIPQDYMLDRINQALLAALKKDNPAAAEALFVDVNREQKKIAVYIQKTVVEEVEEPAIQLTLDAAKKLRKSAAIGDVLNVPIEPKKFGRIAAQAAKQVIIQGIREAERSIVYEVFTSKEHEILTGTVYRIDQRTGNALLKINSSADFTEAMLPAGERIPGEVLREGDKIKVYVVEVRKATSGPQVLISRTHPGLVKRLFELEVPEIFDGTVEIRSISREAGSRTKIAVYAKDPAVEPVGACVGPKGGRVAAIVNELKGEKIDIVKYSEEPEAYIASALSPAAATSVTVLPEGKSCTVVVPDTQLSLAIGKEGQNVRLAARLTGYKIDIKPESKA